MLNYFKEEFNETTTTNGAFAYKSTKSDVLGLFSQGGAYRNRSDKEVVQLFSKAFAENPLLAMKTLFYLRDVTQGQGERRFFRLAIQHLANNHKESLVKNLHLIPHFGRWDDILVLLETPVKYYVIKLISEQWNEDMFSDNPSLMFKWLPSENASSPKTKKYAKIIRESLKITPRQYRKTLTSMRKKINIVETKLSEKDYSSIDYSKLPSKAGLIYRGAFYRNDEDRYTTFLDSLSKGEATVNSKSLYPYEIVQKAFEGFSGKNVWNYGKQLTEQDIQLLDGQWKNLPDFIEGKEENSIAVVDTSGSMGGTPMNVAVSLGIYMAERNKGPFHNHFFTFSSSPQLKEIKGGNIVEKARNLSDSSWGHTTNIEAVFKKILKVAVDNNLSQEEMIGKAYIISDMQFDSCVDGARKHIFKNMAEKFEEHGYKLPSLVFWNVNAFAGNTPFTFNEEGVQLVSGFSPSIFKTLMSGKVTTPYDLMLEAVNNERYAEVTV